MFSVVCKSPKTKILQLESSSPVHFMMSLHLPNSDLLRHCRADPLKNVTVICFYTGACLQGKIVLLKIASYPAKCVRDLHLPFSHMSIEGFKGNFFHGKLRGRRLVALLGSLLSTCSNVSMSSVGYNLGVSSFMSGTRTERMSGFLDMSKANLT